MGQIDPEAAAWLAAMAETGVTLDQLPVADARAAFAGVIAQCGGEPEPVATISTRNVPGPDGEIPVRIYTPQGSGLFPVLVYFHGGGWVIGSPETYDNVCTRLANRSHSVVVSVDYRMAPEHPFPAAIDDAVAAVQWVADHAGELNADVERIAVGGDSAGGNIAAVVALHSREHGPRLSYQLLIYPATDFARETESFESNGEGYFLTRELIDWFGNHYAADPTDWRASPLRASSLANLPPAYVVTAQFDPLRDEGEQYAAALRAAGTEVTVNRVAGQPHGFISMLGAISAGSAVLDDAGLALRAAARQGWRPQLWLQEA